MLSVRKFGISISEHVLGSMHASTDGGCSTKCCGGDSVVNFKDDQKKERDHPQIALSNTALEVNFDIERQLNKEMSQGGM